MFPIEIETDRLSISEFDPSDAALIWRYTSDHEGIFFEEGRADNEADVARWIEEVLALARRPERLRHQFAVHLRDGGELIGTARLHNDIPHDLQGSVGYAFGRGHWGRGFAFEAATAMLDFGFDTLGLHRIEATIEPDNQRSLRVAEKLGLRLEGRMKERFRFPDGWRDALLYATTEDEWRRRRESV